jgi:hypothetical protein
LKSKKVVLEEALSSIPHTWNVCFWKPLGIENGIRGVANWNMKIALKWPPLMVISKSKIFIEWFKVLMVSLCIYILLLIKLCSFCSFFQLLFYFFSKKPCLVYMLTDQKLSFDVIWESDLCEMGWNTVFTKLNPHNIEQPSQILSK